MSVALLLSDPHPGDERRSSTLWRIRDRVSFAALRREGVRVRRGPLSLTWSPATDPELPPRVAFAISRRAGGAVVRNRIRRRLRAACAELRREGRLPGGTYLFSAGPAVATMPWPELVALVEETTRAARARSRA